MSNVTIITVRDPDASNDVTVFDSVGRPLPWDTAGGVRIPLYTTRLDFVDVDLGYADLTDPTEYAEWAESHTATADTLPGEARLFLLDIVAQNAPDA